MQQSLEAGDLPGTPSEARAVEQAYELGRLRMLLEVLDELQKMAPSMSALDARVDLRDTYKSELKFVAQNWVVTLT